MPDTCCLTADYPQTAIRQFIVIFQNCLRSGGSAINHQSTTIGLYFGTRIFMITHPMRYATAQMQNTIM